MIIKNRNDNRGILIRCLGVFIFAAASMAYCGVSCTPTPDSPLVAPEANGKFVLMFTGNWEGKLEPCGCTQKQLGGIDRRSHIIRQTADNPETRLMLDVGPLIEKQNRQAQLKFETFLYSLRQLDYDAINLTPNEIILLRENLSLEPDQHSPVVCSNIPADVREKLGVQEFLKKTLHNGRYSLDCLVFTLADPAQLDNDFLAGKLQLQDPVSALKESLTAQNISPDRPSENKLVIVMLSAVNEPLTQELRAITALDIVVTVGTADEPRHYPGNDGQSLLITTGKMGKYIVQIDVPLGSIHATDSYEFRSIAVESEFPKDPAIIGFINDYQTRLEMEDLIADRGALPRELLEDGNSFLGNASCNGCHVRGLYERWQSLGHAHAMQTLQRVNRSYDPECVVCHTVGMKYEGGYRSMQETPELAGVGCEMCHGPGAKHVEEPLDEYQIVFTACEECHTYEQSPPFYDRREKYFNNIQHWQGPRRYWP